MADLSNRCCVITGGSRGLGRAFAEALLARGANVALLDVLRSEGAATAAELEAQHGPNRVLFLYCDVTDADAVREALDAATQRFGPLFLMCNNAGVANDGFDKWRQTVAINVDGVIIGTLEAVQRMRAHGLGGAIVNVASVAGLIPVPFGPVYAATKHAVVGLCTSMWGLRRSEGIAVHALCPSFTDTKMAATQEFTKRIPLLTAEFVAEGLIKLLDDGARRESKCVMVCSRKLGHGYVRTMRPSEIDGHSAEVPTDSRL